MSVKYLSLAIAVAVTALPLLAQGNPMVGGAAMFADRNIVENAVNSADHTTLVAAVQAAGLVDTLQTEGPFTVFAPVNAAFARLDQAALAQLLEPQHKAQLTQILTCHVLGANAMSDVIMGMADEAGGTFEVTTLGGCVLTVAANSRGVTLTDEQGRFANVTIADVRQSNGVIHVIDRVLLPAM